MKVIVFQGGNSPEREVSFKTGAAVVKALTALGHNVATFDPKEDSVTKILDFKPDAAFLALHGKGGEDGSVQGLLECLQIPYTASDILVSALCMNKLLTKQVLSQYDVLMPKHWVFSKNEDPSAKMATVSYPVVVKPNDDGSTIGITIVKDAGAFSAALKEAFVYGSTVLVEEFIAGKELTVGVLNGKALAIVEIEPKSGFYDYKSKYTPGMTEYFCPARLDTALTDKILKISEKIVQHLGCSGAPRVDYILDKNNQPYFLEVNTIPGMTETSLLPKTAAAVGMSFNDLCTEILKTARYERATARVAPTTET